MLLNKESKPNAIICRKLYVFKYSYLIRIKVKLATLVEEGDLKAPFSIAITLRCREGRFSIPWIAPL